jgi:hypothetical protein
MSRLSVVVCELPVHFTGEGGVGIEVEVLGQVNWIGVALGADGTGRVGVKPPGIEPDFVLIEFLLPESPCGEHRRESGYHC